LCGDVVLTSDGGARAGAPLGAKTLALLAFLALEPGAHRRERVTALLWGDSPEEKARASLRQALSHLRDALGELLRVDRSTVELAGPLACDVTEFLRRASEDPASALEIDVSAFLESLTIRNCRAFEEWADERRAGLVARWVDLVGTLARDAMARRSWLEAATLAERWARLAPLADEPIAVQMEARFLAGDRAGALALHARHLARLEADGAGGAGRALAALALRIERSPA
jgi:DNA-binding SARP family transcriptional activator